MLSNNYKKALLQIAHQLNDANIRWALGAGCLLYVHGIVNSPTDLDILVHTDDHMLLQSVLSKYDIVLNPPNQKYQTAQFYELQLFGIEMDIMIDFKVVTDTTLYSFPFHIDKVIIYQGTCIPLGSLDEWYRAYQAMGRYDKVLMIENRQQRDLRI